MQRNMDRATLDAWLSHKRRAFCLPGLSVAIVQNGRVIYQRSLGTAGLKRPMTPQTPLILGSLSKSFTALAIMQLKEAGQFHLFDPVQHHVPWFRLTDAYAAASITIEH